MENFRSTDFVRRNVRFWRQERRLTIRGLAAILGVSFSTLADWEGGKRRIPADQLEALAYYLRVEPGVFFVEPPTKHSGELDADHTAGGASEDLDEAGH